MPELSMAPLPSSSAARGTHPPGPRRASSRSYRIRSPRSRQQTGFSSPSNVYPRSSGCTSRQVSAKSGSSSPRTQFSSSPGPSAGSGRRQSPHVFSSSKLKSPQRTAPSYSRRHREASSSCWRRQGALLSDSRCVVATTRPGHLPPQRTHSRARPMREGSGRAPNVGSRSWRTAGRPGRPPPGPRSCARPRRRPARPPGGTPRRARRTAPPGAEPPGAPRRRRRRTTRSRSPLAGTTGAVRPEPARPRPPPDRGAVPATARRS
mmetsp:Transcript_12544/g.33546  ORF Transcript_12544/g.33546 Transcript_12544/m.33546 type:complete len:263 (+) Transcript_12544:274-1062(+)